MLTIQKKKIGDEMIVSLEGRLDTTTSEELNKELEALPDDIKTLVFDMSKLDYISSIGLRILLNTHKKMAESSGSMEVRNASRPVLEIFELTGFTQMLNIKYTTE